MIVEILSQNLHQSKINHSQSHIYPIVFTSHPLFHLDNTDYRQNATDFILVLPKIGQNQRGPLAPGLTSHWKFADNFLKTCAVSHLSHPSFITRRAGKCFILLFMSFSGVLQKKKIVWGCPKNCWKLLKSPPTPQKSYLKFRNPRMTFENPKVS
jgi:hypothetical protein